MLLCDLGTSHRRADCDVNCHKKCEKLTANLCGVNQKLIVEALSSVRRGKRKRLPGKRIVRSARHVIFLTIQYMYL